MGEEENVSLAGPVPLVWLGKLSLDPGVTGGMVLSSLGACPSGAFVSAVTQAIAKRCDPKCKDMERCQVVSSLLPGHAETRADTETQHLGTYMVI